MQSKKISAVFMATMLSVGILLNAFNHSNNQTYASSSSEIQEDLNKTDEALEALKKNLGNLNSELYDLSMQIEDIEDNIDSIETEIEQTNAELEEAQETADKQYADMSVRIQFMYEKSVSNSWFSMLFSEGFGNFLNRLEYVTEIATRDKELMDEYEATLAKIESCKANLEEKQTALLSEQESLSEKKAALLAKISQVNSDIQMTEAERAELDQQLQAMIEFEKEQEKNKEPSPVPDPTPDNPSPDPDPTPDNPSPDPDPTPDNPSPNPAPTPTPDPVIPEVGEEELLAALIYCEGGSMSYEFQMAVASVVINRVNSSVYPNNVTDVIYQKGQFSPARSGRLALVLEKGLATESCKQAAAQALSGNVTGPWIGFRFDDGTVSGDVIEGVVFF